VHWKFLDVANVRDWECEPLEWIIENIIAKENLVFVGAASQTGKTLIFLYISLLLARGGDLFGKFRVNPINNLLYMVLEDPTRRIKARILDMQHEADISRDKFHVYIAPGFQLNDDLGFLWFEEFLRQGGYEVVILDTYQKATPGLSSFKDEDQSKILHKLADLTRKLNVTIIVLDHIRKNNPGRRRSELDIDDLKGTGGKAQNSDAWILMDRFDGKLRLKASSKDADKPVGFLLEVSPQGSMEEKFIYAGDLEEYKQKAKQKAEENKKSIIAAMQDMEWISTGGLNKKTGHADATIRRHLKSLITEGKVVQEGSGRYTRYRLINQSSEMI
jgi:hypothetical protein